MVFVLNVLLVDVVRLDSVGVEPDGKNVFASLTLSSQYRCCKPMHTVWTTVKRIRPGTAGRSRRYVSPPTHRRRAFDADVLQ